MKLDYVNRIIDIEKTDSTQNMAREVIKENPAGNILIIAGEQTNGHGQRGAEWSSNPGGLYFTLVTKCPIPDSNLPDLSLKTSEAVKETLAEYGIISRIKPPNDVYAKHNEKYYKIAGILIDVVPAVGAGEAVPAGGNGKYLLFGIGINTNNELPKELPEAVSMKKILKKETEREDFLKKFFKVFWEKFKICQCGI